MKWRILYWFLMQGLGVVVMGVGIYVLYQERREERLHAQGCNERLIEMSAEQLDLIRELRDYIKQPAAGKPSSTVKTRLK